MKFIDERFKEIEIWLCGSEAFNDEFDLSLTLTFWLGVKGT